MAKIWKMTRWDVFWDTVYRQLKRERQLGQQDLVRARARSKQ